MSRSKYSSYRATPQRRPIPFSSITIILEPLLIVPETHQKTLCGIYYEYNPMFLFSPVSSLALLTRHYSFLILYIIITENQLVL